MVPDAPTEHLAAEYKRLIADIDASSASSTSSIACRPRPRPGLVEPPRMGTSPGNRPLVSSEPATDHGIANTTMFRESPVRQFLAGPPDLRHRSGRPRRHRMADLARQLRQKGERTASDRNAIHEHGRRDRHRQEHGGTSSVAAGSVDPDHGSGRGAARRRPIVPGERVLWVLMISTAIYNLNLKLLIVDWLIVNLIVSSYKRAEN